MPLPSKFYTAEGKEVTLEHLCRVEPEWAANMIRELTKQYDELLDAIEEADRVDRDQRREGGR